MNNKLSKKIRRVANQHIKVDLEQFAKVLSNAPLYWRIVYAIRIVFKYHPSPIEEDMKRQIEYLNARSL